MTWTKKAMLYIAFLIVSLCFLAVDHRGVVFGDHLFRLVGLPPWSNHDQGFHYSVILSMILIFISGNLVIKHFRTRYNKVARKVVIACIIFFIMFPAMTKGTMMLVHYNHSGLAVLDYSKKDYRCSHTTHDDVVSYHCTIKLFNYGNQSETVQIKPIIERIAAQSSDIPAIEIQYKQVMLRPRSEATYSIAFESEPTANTSFGFSKDGGVSFKLDGQEKRVFWY